MSRTGICCHIIPSSFFSCQFVFLFLSSLFLFGLTSDVSPLPSRSLSSAPLSETVYDTVPTQDLSIITKKITSLNFTSVLRQYRQCIDETLSTKTLIDTTSETSTAFLHAITVDKKEKILKTRWNDTEKSVETALRDGRIRHAFILLNDTKRDIIVLSESCGFLNNISEKFERSISENTSTAGEFSVSWLMTVLVISLFVITPVFVLKYPRIIAVFGVIVIIWVVPRDSVSSIPERSTTLPGAAEYTKNVLSALHIVDMFMGGLNMENETDGFMRQMTLFTQRVTDLVKLPAIDASLISEIKTAEMAIALRGEMLTSAKKRFAGTHKIFIGERILEVIDELTDEIERFGDLVKSIEKELYSVLTLGLRLNRQFEREISTMMEAIRNGKLSLCLHILSSIKMQQIDQRDKLASVSVKLEEAMNIMKNIRKKVSEVEKPLLWVETIAGTVFDAADWAVYAESAIGVTSVTLLAGTAPTWAAPAALLTFGGAIVATYAAKGCSQSSEELSRAAYEHMGNIANHTLEVSRRISEHRSLLWSLIQDVEIMSEEVDYTVKRFGDVNSGSYFTKEEENMLLDVCKQRISESLASLCVTYMDCITAIFDQKHGLLTA